jgi:short-subunit dehydrogenase
VTQQPRVVVVTGASSGIGRATASRASSAGDHVVLVARGRASLDEVAGECQAAGAASVMVLATDVSDDTAVQRCVAAVVARHGRIDAVVLSAGVVAYGRTEKIPVDIFDAVVRTNLLGSVNVARHVLPLMRERNAGTFVQIGSVIGHIAVPMMSPYVLSKWGIRALARQLQVENRDRRGVRICYVAPGGVDTPIYLQAARYAGHVGRPPPPVVTPEAVARVAMRQLERPRKRTQVGSTNNLIRLGFSAAPGVFDLLVGRLFPVGATDLTYEVPDGQGNVLTSQPQDNRLRGNQGNAALGVARNISAALRAKLSRSEV